MKVQLNFKVINPDFDQEYANDYKDDAEFNFSIPNVSIFRCHLEDGSVSDFAVSKSVLNKTHQARNEKYKTTRCYFYINPEPTSLELGSNLVINESEMPEELKVKR